MLTTLHLWMSQVNYCLNELAAGMAEDHALQEAELGNRREARRLVQSSLRLMPDSIDVKLAAALALARSGDLERATALGEEIARLRPLDFRRNLQLASVRAAIELDRKNPNGAVAQLQRAVPYDLSEALGGLSMYYRGLALLELNSGKAAEVQFQRVLNNPGITFYFLPQAQLGLARANALEARNEQGVAADAARTRALDAYREFFALWKEADSDIPILKKAKAEYAKLQ